MFDIKGGGEVTPVYEVSVVETLGEYGRGVREGSLEVRAVRLDKPKRPGARVCKREEEKE